MRTRTSRRLSVVTIAAGASLLLTGTANAVPGPNGIPEIVTASGSAVTFDVTGAIFADANSSWANTDPDNYINQATGDCAVAKGRLTDLTDTIDVARCASGRGASDPASFEFYGFAKDGVSWAASSTGAGAGVTLTLTQLRDIYKGSITNWNQVGGANAGIKVYLPQPGSDTLAFFANAMLGFDPTTFPVTINRFQEDDATTIPVADQATAIAPYSVTRWIAQGNTAVPDKRAGFFEGTLTGAGSDSTPVSGSAGTYAPAYNDTFVGARTVYHVLNTTRPRYPAALNVLGFDSTGPSPLCRGALGSTLSKFGFKPLASNAGATCTKV
jgi:phosphate transport system substrate-binding protein